jgi:hypothetical protein
MRPDNEITIFISDAGTFAISEIQMRNEGTDRNICWAEYLFKITNQLANHELEIW